MTLILRPDASGLVEHAPAKLNLALHVRGRRADGYHELETIFAFTNFGDTLRAAPSDGLTLAVDGEFAGPAGVGEDNLVLRAARALAAAAGIEARAALHLTKRIPVAAGLGGGSADAAAALRLLDRMWSTGLGSAALTGIAASLGADVPACVASATCFGTGRGEALAPVDLGLGGTPVVIVNPRVAVPTGPVFAAWDGVDRGPAGPGGGSGCHAQRPDRARRDHRAGDRRGHRLAGSAARCRADPHVGVWRDGVRVVCGPVVGSGCEQDGARNVVVDVHIAAARANTAAAINLDRINLIGYCLFVLAGECLLPPLPADAGTQLHHGLRRHDRGNSPAVDSGT